MLRTKYPDEWRQGHIVPILKSGFHSDPANYRPDTINSCLGKLFSYILNERISTFLEDNKVMFKLDF